MCRLEYLQTWVDLEVIDSMIPKIRQEKAFLTSMDLDRFDDELRDIGPICES
jgi:hypothetical protein